MKKNQFQAFVSLFEGDEEAASKWLEENAGELNRMIDDQGLLSRSQDTPEEVQDPQVDEPQVDEPEEEPVMVELDEPTMKEIVSQVLGSEPFQGIQEAILGLQETLKGFGTQIQAVEVSTRKIKDIQQRVSELEKEEDQKRETWKQDLPRRKPVMVTHRPSRAASKSPDGKPQMDQMAASTLANMP